MVSSCLQFLRGVILPSNVLVPGEHGSHWHRAAQRAPDISQATLLWRWLLVGDDCRPS